MYKKILIPTDGSPFSTRAAHAGVAFARQLDAEIVGLFVAHQYHNPVFMDVIPLSYPDEKTHITAMHTAGESYLREIEKAAAGAGLKYSGMTLISDETAKKIVESAEKEYCDLIFMGAHGRSGWQKFFLGSITSKVLAICDLPVLVHREKQKFPSS